MYCLSKDKRRIVNTEKFSINTTIGAEAFHVDSTVENIHKKYYAIIAEDTIMEIFNTEQEAKTKLLTILDALSKNVTVFEF